MATPDEVFERFIQDMRDDRLFGGVRPGDEPQKKRPERRAVPAAAAPVTPT